VNRSLFVLLITFLFGQLSGLATPARLDSLIDAPAPLAAPTKVVAHNPKLSEKPHELHRLDFRMAGKSCPVCLLSIQKKIKTLDGVQDAAVMLKRPYGVSVIYKMGNINSVEILNTIKEKEPTIKIFDIKDNKIDNVPVPLIPPFMPVVEPTNITPDNTLKPMNGGL
jgi:hypothetical protein